MCVRERGGMVRKMWPVGAQPCLMVWVDGKSA